MKYLLVLAIVVAAVWLWRANRPAARREASAPRPQAQAQVQVQDMVSCAVCDLHVPRADAVAGRRGALYCSAGHRHTAEG